MIQLLSNLIGAVAAVGLILSALIYMVSPKQGVAMLKRVATWLLGLYFGLCLLGQLISSLTSSPWFYVLLIAVSIAAYFIYEARLERTGKETGRSSGAERTPVMPTHFDKGRK